MSFEKIMAIGGTGLNAQLVRMNATASNLANVGVVSGSEATAFRAQRPVFAALLQGETAGGYENLAGGVRIDRIVTDTKPIEQIYEPGNAMANEEGYVFSSNVSEIEELIDMLDASRAYQNNVEVISTAKDLMIKTLDIIKV
ncbi:MAG: flagellar basal body rod protein FlgC [Gammaproteobacteria bacterium]|jgi:flagellar basal-body rod protein FlgC|nr:flagellar basal body rod protein FlgC [Gammaproteobacteria bacterium]|tara:strand:- start:1165 stop:1590 length:426 start_codon:yes stop_codon:yes gene_type:complete